MLDSSVHSIRGDRHPPNYKWTERTYVELNPSRVSLLMTKCLLLLLRVSRTRQVQYSRSCSIFVLSLDLEKRGSGLRGSGAQRRVKIEQRFPVFLLQSTTNVRYHLIGPFVRRKYRNKSKRDFRKLLKIPLNRSQNV